MFCGIINFLKARSGKNGTDKSNNIYMNMENPPKEEKIFEIGEILKMIGENGFNDEAKAVYGKFLDREQALVETVSDQARLNIKIADVYLATGDIQGALECLDGSEEGNQTGILYQLWREIVEAEKLDSNRYSNLAERNITTQALKTLYNEIASKIESIEKMIQK